MASSAKKAKTAKTEEYTEELATGLENIDACQNEIDTLNEKASEEVLKVEQKYNTLRRPLFHKRTELTRKIPDFWLTALLNHPQIGAIVDDQEEDCFEYLDYLDVEEGAELRGGYKLYFYFHENPHFSNTCLIKEYQLGTDNQFSKSTSTPIEWKEGKDLTKLWPSRAEEMSRRKRHVEYKSFFDWFQDNSDPTNDEIAELIKDDLWPNPLQYFLVPDIEIPDEEGEEDVEEGDGGEEEQEEDGDSN